ncbi:acyl-CoA thioesterase [Archaeoglobales archaeon]|nr:MAG: acyl-CoA thioesterase [Archaeoglobales archaeon]
MYSFEIEVWFRDVDSFGHVNNAAICSYLETARFKYFKEKFGSFKATFVLARAEIDYLAPLFLGEIVTVNMWVGKIGNTSWEFVYEIKEKETNRLAVKAKTIQVWYDLKQNKKMPIPEDVRKVFEVDLKS